MTSVVTNGGETTVSFGYDDANRQIWEDQTLAGGYATHRISTPRDADGNRQSLDASGINHLTYQYNQRNQLTHILNGSVDPFYDFSYDAAGNKTQRQSRVWYTSVSNFAYDELNRVTMGEQGTSGWIFARSWYQYDKAGRELATWRDENHGLGSQRGERFGYAADNQVVSVLYDANNVWAGGTPSAWTRSVGYGYSADTLNRASVNDNGVVTSYSPNALNQYQTFNGVTYNYDYNFNLREAPNWWGVFDAESRLTQAGHDGNTAQLTYDGLGRCVRRIVYPPGAPSNTVIYVYDGWKPVLEFDAAGNYRASNVYGVGADEILFRWDTVYGGFIYKEDRHGNVVAVLDQWGNIAERYSYDAFGKAKIMSWWDNIERTSSWIGNRFMFQGREWLGEFGIYDYRHRMYNPGLGRFIQTDPMGLQTEGEKLSAGQKALFSPGGSAPEAFGSSEMNLFRYCGDDPVDNSDPMGLLEYRYDEKLSRPSVEHFEKKVIKLLETSKHYKQIDSSDHRTITVAPTDKRHPAGIGFLPADKEHKNPYLFIEPYASRYMDAGTLKAFDAHPNELLPGGIKAQAVFVGHEIGHLNEPFDEDRGGHNVEKNENPIRHDLGLDRRPTYNGVLVP